MRVPPPGRRGVLAGALAVAAAGASRAAAADPGAAAALDTVDTAAAEVAARLRALAGLPAARPFAESLLKEQARQAGERGRLRHRLGLAPYAAGVAAPARDRSLPGLRAAQQALVSAHAEALPALRDPAAVDRLGRALVVASRHLTLIDLWIESEERRD